MLTLKFSSIKKDLSEHLWKVITIGPHQALFSKSSYSEYFFIVSVGLRNTHPNSKNFSTQRGLENGELLHPLEKSTSLRTS